MQGQEKVVKDILKRVYDMLRKSRTVLSSGLLETPRYATFNEFFGVDYEHVRKWK